MKIDDELLVAYADGELGEEQRARVAHALATDETLQARLEALTHAGVLAHELFEARAHEEVPTELVQAIMQPQTNTATRDGRRTPGWIDRLAAWLSMPPPAMVAASAALLAVGSIVGYLLPRDAPSVLVASGPVPSDSTMHLLLNTRPSGEIVHDGALRMEIVGTFAGPDRVCREYRVTRGDSRREYHAGIACLEGKEWSVAFAVDDYLETEPAGGFYETASDTLDTAIDRFIDEHLENAPALDDAAEHEWLGRGWRRAG